MKKDTKKQLITMFILIIFLGSGFAFAIISAIPSGPQNVNWMFELKIFINGIQEQIPSGIGMDGETPVEEFFVPENNSIIYFQGISGKKLEDFFIVWKKNFNSTCILDYCDGEMKMYVNGKRNSDFDQYVFNDKDLIVIDYNDE